MPNILKYLSLSALIFLLPPIYAQKLINSTFNLNPGGIVRDVAYDAFNDVYYFVGDFTSFNGEECPNFAVVNGDDFTVNTSALFNVIEEIDGPINSVEAYQDSIWTWDVGWVYRFYIYFGGNFTSVNDEDRNGIFKVHHVNYTSGELTSAYTLHAWNPELEEMFDTSPIIYDMVVKGDTMIISGDFSIESPYMHGVLAYNLHSNIRISDYPSTDFYDFASDYPIITHLELFKSDLFVTSIHWFEYSEFGKIKSDGSLDDDFYFGYPGLENYFNCVGFDDSLITVLFSYYGGGGVYDVGHRVAVFDPETGDEVFDHSFSWPPVPSPSGINQSQLTVYKDFLFSAISSAGAHKNVYSMKMKPIGEEITEPNWESNCTYDLNIDWRKHLFIKNNILFASFDNLTTAEGEGRIGLMAYCLEPMDLEEFTEYDTLICQSDTIDYAVGQVDYVDGYIWEYTGGGVDIGNTGFENNSDTLYNSYVDAWAQTIRFTETFAPGDLIVTPFSTCGQYGVDEEDMLLGESIQISINTKSIPHAYAGDDIILTCSENEALLHGHSDSIDVSYEWMVVGGDPGIDTHFGQDTTVHLGNDYRLKVINELGCMNFDTLTVLLDTIRPNFDPISGPFDLTCIDSVRSYLGFCNNLSDTTSFWVALESNDTSANPIDVSLPGQYNFYTINNANGCIDSLPSPIVVYLNQPSPNIKITDYEDAAIDAPIDTIDCYNPTLVLTCYSDTAETLLNWVNADSTEPIGDLITISEAGNYYILATNTVNGCKNFKGVNIAADFTQPNVILPEITALNCSNDSLVLNGGTIFLDTALEWNGDWIPPSENPVTIYDPGWYFLTVTKFDNGCSKTDSLEVVADNSIDVNLGNDTMICDGSLLFLTGDYIGDIGGISYLWNDGSTASTNFYTGGIDEYASIEIFGDDDCYGQDTLWIDLPPVPVIEFDAFQPCGEGSGGSIVAHPISGLAPFNYSIDEGVSFQSEAVFSDLDFGTYTIWVRDTLDCLYSFEVTIDQSSDLPEPTFMFSTYNFQMDTVVVVDVSNPPTDSVHWEFSEALEWVGEIDGSPLIKLPETGSFFITMNAFFGDCMITSSKEIFVTEFDSTFANSANQNGIKSIELYPNPTTGNFTLSVEFYKKQRAHLAIQDMIGYVYEERVYDEGESFEAEFEMDISVINGTYVLKLISEFDAAYITFVLSR